MHSYFIVPAFSGTGLSSVTLGVVHALSELGVRVAYYKPVTQNMMGQTDPSLLNPYWIERKETPITLAQAQKWVAEENQDLLLERVLTQWQAVQQCSDVVVVEGLVPQTDEEYIDVINQQVARVLGSDIIIIAAQSHYSIDELDHRITLCASLFGGLKNPKLVGAIINKLGAPSREKPPLTGQEVPQPTPATTDDFNAVIGALSVFQRTSFRCLGRVPWQRSFISPRTRDVAHHLNANILNEGHCAERRVYSLVVIARTVANIIDYLKPGALLITPGDREDVLLAIALAEVNGIPLAGVVLNGNMAPSEKVLRLCEPAFAKGLPVMTVATDTLDTARAIERLSPEIPADDDERRETVMQGVAHNIDAAWLAEHGKLPQEQRLSPPAFKYQLVTLAKAAGKRIVLPEGEEPRTVQAAVTCVNKAIAQCVLLGKPDNIRRVAENLNLVLPDSISLVDPEEIRQRYVQPMVQLRAHKGMTAQIAEAQLEDNVVLGTMMLAQGEVDGLVSGAIHTTANTIRPALQLIKTKPDSVLVSSVFFMLLPEQVLVYGDCAVNPDPDAASLADIAIQSGDTARGFGVEPKIAMISYSTGSSGTGVDVEKVREATAIAKSRRPDLLIDGPLQYDAAAIESVARTKAPDSPVAGKANVFIFPDLNTGNTTYKAVQRSAKVLSVGPVLQGLKKPVNDLSRGALVEDIVYTIAITAIQASMT